MLTLQINSLNWALQHAIRIGDTDIFPLPFEYKAIEFDWDNIRSYLSSQDILTWMVRPHRTLLSPKGIFGFRAVTQLDPLDFLLLAATIKEIASDLEARRIPTMQDTVFSYRCLFNNNGQLFDPSVNYSGFLSASNRIISENTEYSHVATADIADFYSRIYHHRLENALRSGTTRTSHVSAIMHLLSGWNGTETFGIPVGNAPSRLLAESTIADVDEALLANSVKFVRFNDDYRIFARSHAEAYRYLAFLADVLFRNHGLHLQPQKTAVYTSDEFRRRFISSMEDREIDSLNNRFDQLLRDLNIENRYEQIDYADLNANQQALIDSLNLATLFREELNLPNEPDFSVIRFVLRRLGQLGDASLREDVLENIDKLYPAFPDIIEYLLNLPGLTAEKKHDTGSRILDLMEDSIISELEYHKMWALELFTHSTDWNNEGRFYGLLGAARDMVSRRKLILAMGRASQRHWFQTHWRNLFDEPAWPRRALLAAASCMPADARRHYYHSVEARLDPLEKAVMRWAKQHPFGPT